MRNAVAAVIAVTITACSSSAPPTATLAPLSPVSTAAVPAATSAPPISAATTPTMRPSSTPITDASQAFRPLTSGWRPNGPTFVIASSSGSGDTTLVALPFGPSGAGAPTPIVSFGPGPWSLRPDGGAVAVAAWTGRGARIAVWDARSGAARWLTADEPGTNAFSPLWSKDGASVYYASSSDDGKTTGLFEVRADGSGKKQIKMAEERNGSPQELTPDGSGLVWSRGQAGGSVEILDIATGINRHLEDVARVVSWRSQQPRVLLMVGGCCAGRPGGSLVAFDDITLTSRVVAERSQYGETAWGSGVWDPTGTRIAAVRFDSTSAYDGSLVVINAESGVVQPIPDLKGARPFLWLAEGIVFSRPLQGGTGLFLLPNGGNAPVNLYQDAGLIQRIDVPR